jgi:hypothetical protein
MEKINFNKSNNTEKEEIEELFYGSNYINNLNNIFSNNKSKIKTLNKKEKEDTFKELEKNLNIICRIYPETITPLFDINQKENSLFEDKIGQIDFNTIIIRKYNPDINNNLLFYNKYFQILSKIVYPSIQIFYGILNQPEQNNFEIILEYVPSTFEEVQIFISKCLNGNEINYLIISKISEVLSYIYECRFPYLMLYPNNIKFNNKLFKQYFKVSEDSNYLYAINKDYFSNPSKIFNNNFMKIINIGTYLKYKNLDKKYYSIKDESLKNISYFSPEFLRFILDDNIKVIPKDINLLEKWDVYSFGCLLFYIFYKKDPYFFIIEDINIDDDNKLKKLIEVKYNETNFLKTHINYLKEEVKDIPNDIICLIECCTSNNIESRPKFNDILNNLNNKIKPLMNESNNNSKDIFHDYSFYQLAKYNDDLILKKEIIKNQKLENELNEIINEYNINLKDCHF